MRHLSLSEIEHVAKTREKLRHYGCGFMLNDNNKIRLLVRYEGMETNGSRSVQTPYAGFIDVSLEDMQERAKEFDSEYGDIIFKDPAQALQLERALDYICFQQFRRLRRVEDQIGKVNAKTDYNKPLDLQEIEIVIRAALRDDTTELGLLKKFEAAGVRRSDVQRASDYEIERFQRMKAEDSASPSKPSGSGQSPTI